MSLKSIPNSQWVKVVFVSAHLMCISVGLDKRYHPVNVGPPAVWTSYQIRKIAGCARTGNAGKFSSDTDFKGNRQLAIPAFISALASRTFNDACWDRQPVVTGETFPAFPALVQLAYYVSGNRSKKCMAKQNDYYLARGVKISMEKMMYHVIWLQCVLNYQAHLANMDRSEYKHG